MVLDHRSMTNAEWNMRINLSALNFIAVYPKLSISKIMNLTVAPEGKSGDEQCHKESSSVNRVCLDNFSPMHPVDVEIIQPGPRGLESYITGKKSNSNNSNKSVFLYIYILVSEAWESTRTFSVYSPESLLFISFSLSGAVTESHNSTMGFMVLSDCQFRH